MRESKPQYNNARDFLKVLAIVTMTADHVSTAFLVPDTFLYSFYQFFGNFTIVIMCFFIVHGLIHTRSVQNYALRLLGWAMVSEVPFILLFGLKLNVLFTLLASLIIIYLLDRKGWLYAITVLALFFPLSLICDWSIIAPVFTIIYYVLQKQHKEVLSLILIPGSYFILKTILYTETQLEYVLGTLSLVLISGLLLLLISSATERKKGRIPGLVFYAYYPTHLIIIYAIRYFASVNI